MKAPKLPRLTEKHVGLMCDSVATQMGWVVERYEQSRASHITEGLPDRRYVHRTLRCRVWVELKAPDGKLTEAQHQWLVTELLNDGAATVVASPDGLAIVLAEVMRYPFSPAKACVFLREIVADFAGRGYRKVPPKRLRRPRLPR
jgi:hypothetical protein